ncbi:MAG: TerC/Alx family metal homeostasis membrane protein, partial [Ignavibacteria bacterium]|nr:TerC/Alx family metal homeostasis membrane protein [Ignavibacteria bacterium]
MEIELIHWLIFAAVFIPVLSIDLFFSSKREEQIKIKTAILWSIIWIVVAFLFVVQIYIFYEDGHQKALEYVAGYLIEKSLSVDNLFVFILIFQVMGIPSKYQPLILKWGIFGAIVMRVIFIIAGVTLINAFDFIIYFFGAILIFTSYKMAFSEEKKIEPEKNLFVRIASKIFPVKKEIIGKHFFVIENKKLYATPLFLTLMLVESTDLVFAIDSIPAVLAITKDTFIVVTSNIFAILGLRSLFFALAGLMSLFRFLKYGVAGILFFVG